MNRWNQPKLTQADADAIRATVARYREMVGAEPGRRYYARGWVKTEYGVETQAEIAARYGVSGCAISEIVAGRRFRGGEA